MTVVETIKKPFLDLKKLIVGILLGGFPILDFFVLGFALEVMKNPKKELPEFQLGQFILGLKAKVVDVTYKLVQVFFAFLFVFFTGGLEFWLGLSESAADLFSSPEILLNYLGPLTLFGLFLLVIVLPTLLFYIYIAALYEMIGSGSLKDAFNFKNIFGMAFTRKYFLAFITSTLFMFFGLIIVKLPFAVFWSSLAYIGIPLGLISKFVFIERGMSIYISVLYFWHHLGEALPMKSLA